MKRRWVLMGALSLSLAFVTLVLRAGDERPRPAPARTAPLPVADAPMAARVPLQPSRTRRAANLPALREPRVAAAPPVPAREHPAAPRGGNEARTDRLALDARWESEELDQDATDELSAYVGDALRALEVDGDIDALTCKQTLCRMDIHFADLAQAQKFQDGAGLRERRKDIDIVTADGVVDVSVVLARAAE